MRILVDFLLLAPAVLYQLTLAARFEVRGVGIDLLAVALAAICSVQGWLYGAVGGLLCGLVLDGVFGQFGYWSLQYMLFGMAAGLMQERARKNSWLLPLVSVAAAYALKECVPMVSLYFSGAQVQLAGAALKTLLSSAVCVALFAPALYGMRLLHRWDVISAPIFHFHGRKW